MPALARVEAGDTASGIPHRRDQADALQSVRATSGRQLPYLHGPLGRCSLALLRVVGAGLGVGAAARASGASGHADARPVPPISGMQVAGATDQAAPVAGDARAAPHRGRGAWSDASVGLLLAVYPTSKPVRDIAAELGRSVGAIYAKARRLNLKRPRRSTAPSSAGAPSLALDRASKAVPHSDDPTPEIPFPDVVAPPQP